MSQYDTIIIDEAHERSLNIDFILGYLKQLLPKRPDLKVIITSATLDTQRFSEYFSTSSNNKKSYLAGSRSGDEAVERRRINHTSSEVNKVTASNGNKGAPVYSVQGRSYPVEVRYRPLTDEPVTSSDDDSSDDFEENLPRAVVAAVEECFADADSKGISAHADILILPQPKQRFGITGGFRRICNSPH